MREYSVTISFSDEYLDGTQTAEGDLQALNTGNLSIDDLILLAKDDPNVVVVYNVRDIKDVEKK